MKILVTGDLHIGCRGNSDIYLQIFSDWIDNFLIPTIEGEKIRDVYFLGDIFDNRNQLSIKSINIAISKIDGLISNFPNINFKIILGNHDIHYKNTRKLTSLKIFKNRHDNLEIIDIITKHDIDNRQIIFAPWLTNKDEVDELFDHNTDLLFCHAEINDFEMVRGIKETKGLNPKRFKNSFTKTFSGHFHIQQEQNNIIYVGCPYQINWNDYDNDKGVTIIDTKKLNHKFIKNNISPIYSKIFYSQLKNKTNTLDNITNNFIKLILDEPCNDKILDKITKLIMIKKPLSLSIDGLIDNNLKVNELEECLNSPIEYLNSFIERIELPINFNYDRSKIRLMINEIHGRVVK